MPNHNFSQDLISFYSPHYYVALHGDDTLSGNAPESPYATIRNGSSWNTRKILVGNGQYFGSTITVGSNHSIIGDGYVEIDGRYSQRLFLSGSNKAINLIIKNYLAFVTNAAGQGNTSEYSYCIVKNVSDISHSTDIHYMTSDHSLFINCSGNFNPSTAFSNKAVNNTFYNCDLKIRGGENALIPNNIYSNTDIYIVNGSTPISNSVFHNCRFKFGSETSYTLITDLSVLQQRYYDEFTENNFEDCNTLNPMFISSTREDFRIQEGTTNALIGHDGYLAGKYSFAKEIVIAAVAGDSDIDNANAENVTITDNSIVLDSSSLPGRVTSNIIVLSEAYELKSLGVVADFAFRRGQYLSKNSDVDPTVVNTSDILVVNDWYQVYDNTITYNGDDYIAGEKFKVVTGVTSFTTSTSGTLRKILRNPNKVTVEMRYSVGSTTVLDNTATLTVDSYYYVEGNSITYNSTIYNIGDTFKTSSSGGTTFIGSGTVRYIFSDSEIYHEYDIASKPKNNRVGNVVTGSIVRGNGDISYDPNNGIEVIAKFIQIKYTIQRTNLY